ncbi:unnamed protein product [Medioppia subpectinata]|uniref:Short-chain dehydrogenase/reductase 3 n=1 Tax=Medioppia subpectinata TaxID=1979941 RepID=A0A7R9KQF6_9ACAR|nr:unnamed protein product [Medioppia subpectinata]CAG2107915.1 unnamed protein product [Medioppia subpectinata]
MLNGENTLSENIADNGGLRVSYRALEAYMWTHDEPQRLPHELCGFWRSEALKSQMESNPYSPANYWVNVPLYYLQSVHLRFKSVKDKLVLITGGGSGLGRALAIRFAKQGANVIVWDINKSGLNETVELVRAANPEVIVGSYECDITERHLVYETAAKVKRDVSAIDILVNNAGVVNGKNLMDIPDEKIIQTFQVNAISHFWTVKAVLPDMMAANSGHLVSIASAAGTTGLCQLTDYCASKFAAVGFEESLRYELINANKLGVKSTVVLPYVINTGMFAGFKSPILSALEPDYVADQIMAGVLTDAEYVAVPRIFYIINTLKTILPVKAFYKAYEVLGGYHWMEDFVGRERTNHNN